MERAAQGALSRIKLDMLRHLTIRDFVIVDRLELEFAPGFGALTGETGAGKSILIDALSLVLGDRADVGVVRVGCDRAEVAATFDLAQRPVVRKWLEAADLAMGDELLLRRVIDSGGRSRAYINGSAATVLQLREVAENLVDIHGQHAHQSLLRADAQCALLDAHAGLTDVAREVALSFRAWRDSEHALSIAKVGGEALMREREQLEWQVSEVGGVAFSIDEWSQLEVEHRRLAHAATLMEGVQFALAALADGDAACASQINAVTKRIDDLAVFDSALQDVAGLLQSVQVELSEAVSSLRRYSDRVDLDPIRLTEVERRLDAIHACARKYRIQPECLPRLIAEWQVRLGELSQATDLAAMEARVETARGHFLQQAQILSEGRHRAGKMLGQEVTSLMQQLALATGRFEVALTTVEGGAAYGLEQVEFRIAGLAGVEARPLAKVVSGGELSRISLALQVTTSRTASIPTLIFDEVDVGIGGGVAEIVGRLLRELGRERQVLCVTHLPQVAARADWQWRVSKMIVDGGAILSRIERLDPDGRVGEIARMLGGIEITDITRRHARELLSLG